MKTSVMRNEIREVMDIRQAADYLGISPDTLYKYASVSFIPPLSWAIAGGSRNRGLTIGWISNPAVSRRPRSRR